MIRLGKFDLRLPSGKLALAQMGLGAIEMAAAIGALYVLMPAGAFPSFPAFSTLYIGAVLLGIASHAPGGIGVFEATMLALSPEPGPRSHPCRAAALPPGLQYRPLHPCRIGLRSRRGARCAQFEGGYLRISRPWRRKSLAIAHPLIGLCPRLRMAAPMANSMRCFSNTIR